VKLNNTLMAPITKAQAKATLIFILTNIIEDDEDNGSSGPIQLAFRKGKIKGILDINSMSASTLESLSYYDPIDKIDKRLEKGEIGLLKTFRAYIYYRDSIGETLDSNDKWLAISLEDFQRFRVSKEWFAISENPGITVSSSSSVSSSSRDSVYDFKQGIKRDVSLFPTLKQDKQWDSWQRATITQARAQDLSDVLNPKYVAGNPPRSSTL
jgi:hypothetical protein